MKIDHPFVTSAVFKLVTTLEFDLSVGDHFLPTRIEVFQDTELETHFRCRMWERDLFHLKPTSLVGREKSVEEAEFDEEVLVERTWEISKKYEDFKAPDAETAVNNFIESLEEYLQKLASDSRPFPSDTESRDPHTSQS